jgi:hypothetical protein
MVNTPPVDIKMADDDGDGYTDGEAEAEAAGMDLDIDFGGGSDDEDSPRGEGKERSLSYSPTTPKVSRMKKETYVDGDDTMDPGEDPVIRAGTGAQTPFSSTTIKVGKGMDEMDPRKRPPTFVSGGVVISG